MFSTLHLQLSSHVKVEIKDTGTQKNPNKLGLPATSFPSRVLLSSTCPLCSSFFLFLNREGERRSTLRLCGASAEGSAPADPPVFDQALSVCSQEEEDRGKRQVLVLGLDGAGKSSMLQGLSVGEAAAKRGRCRPTRGFNFISLNVPACQLDFLESKAPPDTLYP